MHQRMFGRRNDDIVRDYFGAHLPPEEVHAHGAAKEKLYRQLMADALPGALVPGVREFLAKNARTPMALATNAEAANVDFLLDTAGLRPCFQVVIDGYQVRHPKPDPEIYLLAADKLGAPPRNCIVFEDSYSGVQAARAAGTRVVGVRTTHPDLAGTDLAIDDFFSPELDIWLQRQTPVD
jgi:HAD superfamily hydrolase (TIGR01509 family)